MKHRIRVDAALLLLLVGTAVFHVVTMPSRFYPGDNFTPRAACVSLLTTGDIGIRYEHRRIFGGFLENRGQYFYENDAKQKLFSKYGIGYTLLYLPSLIAEKLAVGDLDLVKTSDSMLLILNIYNILLAALAVGYLYGITSFFTERRWLRVGFVLLSLYTTFLWHYLRAPALEIFQIPVFLGFFYHISRYLQGAESERAARPWRHLVTGLAYALVLILMKIFFVLVLPAVWICVLIRRPRIKGLIPDLRSEVGGHWRSLWWYLVVPSAVIILLLLGVNYYKFGSPFETGYSQWLKADGLPNDRFDIKGFPKGFMGMFVRPGNGNAFIHYPLVVLGLLGWWPFLKKHGRHAAFTGLIIVPCVFVLCCMSNWTGEWCYGPRYLLYFLIAGALPGVLVIEYVARHWRNPALLAAAGLAVLVLGWSTYLQVQVNSLHYFTHHYLNGFFSQVRKSIETQSVHNAAPAEQERVRAGIREKGKAIGRYFSTTPHRGFIHRDFIRYVEDNEPFRPLEGLRDLLPPTHKAMADRLRPQLTRILQRNYYFFE